MGDHRTPYLVAPLFKELAAKKTDKKKLVAYLWKAIEEYDSHPAEMDIDDVLISLGLAKRVNDDEVLYKGLDYGRR